MLKRIYDFRNGKVMTINTEEIKSGICLEEFTAFKRNDLGKIDQELIDEYNDWIDENDEIADLDSLNEFLEENNIDYKFIRCSDFEYQTDLDILIDTDGINIVNLNDLQIEDRYVWWNGNEHITEYLFDAVYEEYDDENLKFINIDEWDGNNHSTEQKFYHVSVAKLPDQQGYITEEYSEYQNIHKSGQKFDTDSELMDYLKKIDRVKYFEQLVS